MKKNLTELVFILDESGSMSGLTADTIGGFNSLIAKQKKEEGEALVSTVFFSNDSKVIHDRVKLEDIPKLTDSEYVPSGCTALLDAVGDAVHHIANIHKYSLLLRRIQGILFDFRGSILLRAHHRNKRNARNSYRYLHQPIHAPF